jgi:hypothetical protein
VIPVGEYVVIPEIFCDEDVRIPMELVPIETIDTPTPV